MTEPIDFLLPPKGGTDPDVSFRFGTVTQNNPLQVLLDGDTTPVPSPPIAFVGCGVGDRVQCMLYHRQLFVTALVTIADAKRVEVSETNGASINIGNGNRGRLTTTSSFEKNIEVKRPGLIRAFCTFSWKASNNAAGYAFIIIDDDGPKYRLHNHATGLNTDRPTSIYREKFVQAGTVRILPAAEVDSGGVSITFGDCSIFVTYPG